jgi:hypothetical protein
VAEPTTYQEVYDKAYQDALKRGLTTSEANVAAKSSADNWSKKYDPAGILKEVRESAEGAKLGIGLALLSDKKYGAQLMEVFRIWRKDKNKALDLLNKSAWAQLPKDARDNYLLKLERSDIYKNQLDTFKVKINKILTEEGFDRLDDQALEAAFLAGKDDETILREALAGFKFKPGVTGGQIGANYDTLRNIAKRNGVAENMLPSVLGFETVDEVIRAIQGGEKIDTFERKIRNYAKTAMPDYVKGLLDEGQDLADIIGPYKAVMVDELELPYNSVDVTDRYMQEALSKNTNLSDFRRMLRRDSRWQYTDKAREEVSSITLGILRDFGFQG